MSKFILIGNVLINPAYIVAVNLEDEGWNTETLALVGADKWEKERAVKVRLMPDDSLTFFGGEADALRDWLLHPDRVEVAGTVAPEPPEPQHDTRATASDAQRIYTSHQGGTCGGWQACPYCQDKAPLEYDGIDLGLNGEVPQAEQVPTFEVGEEVWIVDPTGRAMPERGKVSEIDEDTYIVQSILAPHIYGIPRVFWRSSAQAEFGTVELAKLEPA